MGCIKFRSAWYQLEKAIENDEETQKHGFVVIGYHTGSNHLSAQDLDKVRNFQVIIEAIPFRVGGLHFCYNEETLARQMRTLMWEHIEQRWDEELALFTQHCPSQCNTDGNNDNENNNSNNNEEGGESPAPRPQ